MSEDLKCTVCACEVVLLGSVITLEGDMLDIYQCPECGDIQKWQESE